MMGLVEMAKTKKKLPRGSIKRFGNLASRQFGIGEEEEKSRKKGNLRNVFTSSIRWMLFDGI